MLNSNEPETSSSGDSCVSGTSLKGSSNVFNFRLPRSTRRRHKKYLVMADTVIIPLAKKMAFTVKHETFAPYQFAAMQFSNKYVNWENKVANTAIGKAFLGEHKNKRENDYAEQVGSCDDKGLVSKPSNDHDRFHFQRLLWKIRNVYEHIEEKMEDEHIMSYMKEAQTADERKSKVTAFFCNSFPNFYQHADQCLCEGLAIDNYNNGKRRNSQYRMRYTRKQDVGCVKNGKHVSKLDLDWNGDPYYGQPTFHRLCDENKVDERCHLC